MALNTTSDIMTEVLVRNNRSTTDGFITDTMLKDWTRMAHTWASAFHKWPFTEGRISTTFAAVEEWNFEGYKADSFRTIQVGGHALKKLNFRDYLNYRENEPSGTERLFSDYARIVFINPSIDVSGTLTAWGQYEPVILSDKTVLTETTVFSDYDEEGNEAILEKVSGYLKRREHEAKEAELHDERAIAKLEEVWKRILAEQYNYQTHPDSGGMFKRFDVLRGGITDEIFKRDQF